MRSENDGHTVFSTGAGRYRWLPELDGFLRLPRAADLAAPRRPTRLLKRLNGTERNRTFVEGYLAAPYEEGAPRVSCPTTICFGGWGYKVGR